MIRISGGVFGGRNIKSIAGPGYRPATEQVRQAIFSMLESRGVCWPEMQVIDCFAGSGSLGLESLSRGARLAWFVEKNKKAAQAIRQNMFSLGVEPNRFRVLAQDVFRFLRNESKRSFQVAFVDPPYGKGYALPVLDQIASHVDPDGYVVAEVEVGLDFGKVECCDLELVVNRAYGQTRIGLWMVRDRG